MERTVIASQHRPMFPAIPPTACGDFLRVQHWHGGKIGFVDHISGSAVALCVGDSVEITFGDTEVLVAHYDEPETIDQLLKQVFRCGRRTISIHEIPATAGIRRLRPSTAQ